MRSCQRLKFCSKKTSILKMSGKGLTSARSTRTIGAKTVEGTVIVTNGGTIAVGRAAVGTVAVVVSTVGTIPNRTRPGYPTRISRWSRLVKSHCTISRDYPMEPHFKKENKHMQ